MLYNFRYKTNIIPKLAGNGSFVPKHKKHSIFQTGRVTLQKG